MQTMRLALHLVATLLVIAADCHKISQNKQALGELKFAAMACGICVPDIRVVSSMTVCYSLTFHL